MSGSPEVDEAEGRSPDYDDAQRAAELKAKLAAPSERERDAAELAAIEQRQAAKREARGKAAAERRLVQIARGKGALVAALADYVAKYETAEATRIETIAALNKTMDGIYAFDAEQDALVVRFSGVEVPDVPRTPVPPYLDADVIRAAEQGRVVTFDVATPIRPSLTQDETGLLTWRDFKEVAGTRGGDIIEAAGVVQPRLSAKHQAELDRRKRESDDMIGVAAARADAVAEIHAGAALKTAAAAASRAREETARRRPARESLIDDEPVTEAEIARERGTAKRTPQ